MACLGLVLFYLACFAGDVVELEPVRAHTIPSAITCSGITTATTNHENVCNALPGCTWVGTGLAGGDTCEQDKCLAFGDSTPVTPGTSTVYTCDCSYPGLGVDPQGNCGPWPTPGFPPSNTGSGRDYYCQRTSTLALDECSYQYLRNGSCVAPYCILVDYTPAEGGKTCKKIPECAVTKSTDLTLGNVIRLNPANIGTCLTKRVSLGDTTACNQNPRFYLKNNVCEEDSTYDLASSQDNPTCPTGQVVKQVKGVVSNAETTLSYCANADNPVLNNCWNLVNQTSPSSPPGNQCPVNPKPDATHLTENTNLCKGDCFVQTISSYFYGWTKICVNNESAGGGSSIIVVPSLIALLLLAFFL